jgi:glycerol-3-phosphate acyltransferase PlsY
MRRKIKALMRTLIPFVVAFLVGIAAIWIWRHRTQITDLWSNLFLYYQD